MTNEELEVLVRETRELVEENNRIIRDMRRIGRIAFWSRIAIWLIVLVLPFYLYSAYLAPLLANAGTGASLLGLPSPDQMQTLIEQYQALTQ